MFLQFMLLVMFMISWKSIDIWLIVEKNVFVYVCLVFNFSSFRAAKKTGHVSFLLSNLGMSLMCMNYDWLSVFIKVVEMEVSLFLLHMTYLFCLTILKKNEEAANSVTTKHTNFTNIVVWLWTLCEWPTISLLLQIFQLMAYVLRRLIDNQLSVFTL